jgi:TusA-related sulfurtransferase
MVNAPDAPVLVDLRGLKCPIPALKTRRALQSTPPGGRIRVECTDPLAVIDIPHLLNTTGDVLEEQDRADGIIVFVIRKAG